LANATEKFNGVVEDIIKRLQKTDCLIQPNSLPPVATYSFSKRQAPRGAFSRGADLIRCRYLLSLVWPIISWAVKLMWQVGKELPTKKLSDCDNSKHKVHLSLSLSSAAADEPTIAPIMPVIA
jgi:hypothetical protein